MQKETSHRVLVGGIPRNPPHRLISIELNKQKEGRKATPNCTCIYVVLVSVWQDLFQEALLGRWAQETSIRFWSSTWCHSGGRKNPQFLYNFPRASIPSTFPIHSGLKQQDIGKT